MLDLCVRYHLDVSYRTILTRRSLRVKQARFKEQRETAAVRDAPEMCNQERDYFINGRELLEVDLAADHELHERTDNLGARDGPVVLHANENAHQVEITDVAFEHDHRSRRSSTRNREIRSDMRKRVPGDGVRDAYRHAATSKRIAEEVDPLTSFVAGYLHEVSNALRGQQDWGSFRMDVSNNTYGLARHCDYSIRYHSEWRRRADSS